MRREGTGHRWMGALGPLFLAHGEESGWRRAEVEPSGEQCSVSDSLGGLGKMWRARIPEQ